MNFHLTIEKAKEALATMPEPFVQLLKEKRMSVEYFAPEGTDAQLPHTQDELYIIASGESQLIRDSEKINCKTGDVIFVPAGMPHRFENFSADFATWVIFY
jgi:mannose-6-phosphate isomerase-like protein (cupin superfamily)